MNATHHPESGRSASRTAASVHRLLRFFGRSMFFGIGGLMVSPLTITMNLSANHGRLAGGAWLPVAWAAVCVVWVLLGMVGRSIRGC